MRMLTKLSEAEMIDQAETVIDRVNLIDAKHKLPNEISGGMQKRVAIARAVVMRPKYTFVTNPTQVVTQKQLLLSTTSFKNSQKSMTSPLSSIRMI